jgi:peptidoglycan/LPS O-acetylase OafA/YrhL
MIKQLAFTRFLAAILIVFFHYGKNFDWLENSSISYIINKSNIAVNYFFVLSGFVMMIAYNKSSKIYFLDFIFKRLFRIYPLYLLALLIVLLVLIDKENNLFEILISVFMIQSWVPNKALIINFTGWSIAVEMFFYLIFPWLFNNIYKKYRLNVIIYLVMLFWMFSQFIYLFIKIDFIKIGDFYSVVDLNYLPIFHLNSFLLGNLIGLIYYKLSRKRFKNLLILNLFIFCLIIYILKFNIYYHNGLLSVLFALLILSISISNDFLNRFFSKNIFVFLGDVSYGIYILQFPIWIIFSDYRISKLFYLDKQNDLEIIFLIKLTILIFISIFSYLFFENPLKNRLNSLIVIFKQFKKA